jgi:adenylylsulfate kinase-like enzyme
MYALAREGKIKNFTGIDDPYEPPHNPEIVIDTIAQTAEENAERILAYLVRQGFILPATPQTETGLDAPATTGDLIKA